MTGSFQTTPTIERTEFPSDFFQEDRPYKIVVWNDPINLMTYVTWVLQRLFGYSLDKAQQLMMEVHTKGKAVVASGNREKAEIDAYRLHEYGLWATIEQD